MFTGIIEEIGKCVQLVSKGPTAELEILASKVVDDLRLGDSLSVEGVCLTVRRISGNRVTLDVSAETLERSNLKRLSSGGAVNLERAVRVGGRLGGHIVQGHVDGPAFVEALDKDTGFATLRCRVDIELDRYIAEKGSVSLDGISLTVARKLGQGRFTVAVIPTTFEGTTLHLRRPGDQMNLECDVLAKYVESLLKIQPSRENLSADFLRQHGFL